MGRQKIQDRWQDENYQVVGQPTDVILAYKVQSLYSRKSRILHRYLLLPLQGVLRQEGTLEKEDTLLTEPEDDETTNIPGVPILVKVRPKMGDTTPL